mmetsp:Transcript_21405/g.59539  ORF Transcript_21405/g.59539 Transcript_21405/m.59539 type:complete len:644 (-) Transcript_21405:1258-3189(-)|eukprot:CAMPEP_0172380826 /NCGR_PEP_ID=MMETSP1060-20121228/70633_1 /TAXON_ID=37318 /ORGANISM="Pseudo-nitzschia pungens, Strain cf. cingulata" /LENGTH=643 /DNA_ID=CAMNT_0013108591 /DNA_START=579 /DNA_END=2510 /DNA_ORIENTATION=+
MRNYFFALLLCLAAAGTNVVVRAASSGGKCFAAERFQCPNEKECPDTGFSYVSDCLDCEGNLNTFRGDMQCFSRKLLNGKKNPSKQYLLRDIIGMIVWFFAAGVATACGVGGGGIYVPLGILLLGFEPKPASGLSQASIFGASLGGLLLNLRNTHPYTAKIEQTGAVAEGNGSPAQERAIADVPTNEDGEPNTETAKYYTRPLIDYDMALFLAPMEMAGAVLGVLIQKIFPNWLYLFTAAVILGFTAKKTYRKWWDIRAKELAKQKALEDAADANSEEQAALTPADDVDGNGNGDGDGEDPAKEDAEATTDAATSSEGPSSDGAVEGVGEEIEVSAPPDVVAADDEGSKGEDGEGEGEGDDEIVMDAEKMARRTYFLERDARQYPVEKLVCFAVLWLGLTLLTFFKGGKGVKSIVGIDCTSPWYGVMVGIQFLWTFGFAAYFAIKLMRETIEKKAVGYPYHAQDVLWDFEKTRFYAFFTFVAGIVAGLIGIGGGMVLGPLMLVMGIYPRVSTATTATMIVLTSSSVAILYVTSGLVPPAYFITFFCTCFTGALIGKTKIDGYVKRTGRASLLILLLATIIALATLGAVVIALLRLNSADWCFAGFNEFCSIDKEAVEEVVCVPSVEERMLGSAFFGDVIRGAQ